MIVPLDILSKKDFRKNSGGAYTSALTNKWVDNICSHMTPPPAYNLKWTKEKCHEVALMFNSRGELKNYNNGIYTKARINGWLDEICSHMEYVCKPNGYWTKERCHEEALKFKNRKEYLNFC